MKKRRILATKSILPLFILCLVSAFFYVPLVVSASGSYPIVSGVTKYSGSVRPSSSYQYVTTTTSRSMLDFTDLDLNPDNAYLITANLSCTVKSNVSIAYRRISAVLSDDSSSLNNSLYETFSDNKSLSTSKSFSSNDVQFVIFGNSTSRYDSSITPALDLSVIVTFYSGNSNTVNFSINSCSLDITDVRDLGSSVDINAIYQEAYQTGYSDGESSGYSNGYDSGYSTGLEEGHQSGYNDGYSSGYDTGHSEGLTEGQQIGYHTGYSSGYNEGYSKGYSEGYDSGYDSAMSRIESWGADTANYPILLGSGFMENGHIYGALIVKNDSLFFDDSADVGSFYDKTGSSVSIDPTHTYKVVIKSFDYTYNMSMSVSAQYYLCVGNQSYHISKDSGNSPSINNYFYVPGNVMSKNFFVRAVGTLSNLSSSSPVGAEILINISFDVYDFGPSGNLQNQIANQTDNLTNGYNGTSGDSASSSFSDGVAEYETAENSIFTSASSGLDDFQFFDFKSVPAMITGISFVTSIMTSIFNSMGGLSGAGIVLSVLFSVMLVTMIIGLARRYQSNGKIERIRSYQRDTNAKINALYKDSKKK